MKFKFRHFILIYCSIFLSGCLGSRYLKDEEHLLYKNKISGNKNVSTEALQNLIQQKPNRRIPLIPFSPYVYVYHFGVNHYDQEKLLEEKEEINLKYDQKIKKEEDNETRIAHLIRKRNRKVARLDKALEEGNIWMRWGEKLAVYDSSFSERSADQMRLYLNSKGYFNAATDYTTKKSGKYITNTFHINEGKAHTIDTIFYSISDSAIYKLIKKNEHSSLLEINKNYDADKFSDERDRLDNLFKNNGYYDFTKQYIEFNIDTTLSNQGTAVEMVIHDPPKREYHKSFLVDSVIFTTDASTSGLKSNKRIDVYNNVTYQSFNKRYSKRILDRRLFIHPGDVYSKENTFETQKQLANLDMFKFINVYYDTTGNKTIANITTSPLKKYQTSNEVGLTVIQGFGNWPGPMFNTTLKNRNVFGGMEIFELNARAGIEGVAAATESTSKIYRSQEYGINASLIFPQFLFPLGEKLRYSLGRMNPRTRVLTGYSFTNRPEYQRSILKSSLSYLWQKEQKVVYNLTLADINLINSNIKLPQFETRLKSISPALARSFEPSFVSSIIFSTTFNFNRYGAFGGNSASLLKLYFESGGTSLNFFKQDEFGNIPFLEKHLNLQTFQFLRFYSDFRKYLPHPSGNNFAYRINTGFALPYGKNTALPYEKYFFAGGSNSIRAWRPRRLGPGSYTPDRIDSDEGVFDYRFEQTGEIILEASLEWRRNLVGFLDGALFLDAGNVWTFKEEENREGGNFELKDFYKEIAVGTGVGFRFDFSFLLIRLDIGTKVYDPARSEGDRFVLGNIGMGRNYDKNREPLIYNIGIGYPF